MTKFIAIKNWDHYQHYKDRDPPWIKLYRDTFTTEAWVLGTDSSRLLQFASTLLAARYKNATPLKYALIKRVANLDLSEAQFNAAIDHLAAYEFLEIQELADDRGKGASSALASCSSEGEQSRAEGEQSRAEARERARGAASEEPDPPGLDSEAAAKFIAYRKTRKPAIKPESMAAFKKQLAAYGEEQSAVVEHSIANGYQGLIPPKPAGRGSAVSRLAWEPDELRQAKG